MGLFIIVGSLLIFGNVANPDIETNEIQWELSRYQFEEDIHLQQNGHDSGSFTPRGIDGTGLVFNTVHKNYKNWLGTLNVRYYRAPEYQLVLYSTGIDYVRIRPNSPTRLSVGGEIGIGELDIDRFKSHGKVLDNVGWEVHTAFKSHFVLFNQLWSYFVRPSLRSYRFPFKGKEPFQDELIDASGFVIAAGIGLRY